MALAHIMKQSVDYELETQVRLTAFIVDHQARPGSSEEAEKVSRWLQDLGGHLESRKTKTDMARHPSRNAQDTLADIKPTSAVELRVTSTRATLSVPSLSCSKTQNSAFVSWSPSRRPGRDYYDATHQDN